MKRAIEGKSASSSPLRSRTDSDTQQTKKDSSQIQQAPNLNSDRRTTIGLPASQAELIRQPLQVAAPPTVRRYDPHYGLTPEIWQLVLSKLAVFDLIHAMQCSKSFLLWSRVVPPPLADVNARDADQLKKLSLAHLTALVRHCDITYSESDVREYREVLCRMASLSTSMAAPIKEGFEAAAIAALCNAPRWQHLGLHLHFSADFDMIGELQQALAKDATPERAPRTLDLILMSNVCADQALASYMKPESQSAGQAGLRLRMLHVGGFTCDQEYLPAFLRSDNPLEDLRLIFKSPTDPLLSALSSGLPALRSLSLAELPDSHEDLIEVLESKPGLTALALASGEFTAEGTTVAKLLQARPKLERLALQGIHMQLGSTEACLEAFRRSKLREFGYVGCSFEPVPTASVERKVANAKALFAPYFEFFAGLAVAPCLHTLEIGGEDLGAVGELAALAAFARNPSAARVRCCEGLGVKVSRFVEILNRKRKRKELPPLVLELAIKSQPEHSFYPILSMNKADRKRELLKKLPSQLLEDSASDDDLRADEMSADDRIGGADDDSSDGLWPPQDGDER